MDFLKSARSTLAALLYPPPPAPTFPQFSSFPPEIRLKIWIFALEPRILLLHLHDRNLRWLEDEQRFEGYASSDPAAPAFDGPTWVPGADGVLFPKHMAITSCSGIPCGCGIFQPLSKTIVPLPGVTRTCRESRDATLKLYGKVLGDEYDHRAQIVPNILSNRASLPGYPLDTGGRGLMMIPEIDILDIRINLASKMSVQKAHHFAAIVARYVPGIRKVVVEVQIAMEPFRFWAWERTGYWKKWGAEDGWWVPAGILVGMKDLEEVVVARKRQKMLPVEWEMKLRKYWVEGLWEVQEKWPVEWEGRMPRLRIVEGVEEV